MRYVGAAEVAEDLVQDVFLRLWEKTNPLQGVRDVSAYLYQMVRFRAIDYLRSEKTKEQTVRKYIAGLAEEEEEAYLEEEVYRRMIKAVEEWMMERRKESVVYELRYTDASISEICYKYGFESLPHFSNFCKKNFGASPRSLRAGNLSEVNGMS